MNFLKRVADELIVLIFALVILLAFVAYFGTTPVERYDCEMKTTNPIADAICIVQTAA